MARYNDAVCRLCRREGMKLFLKGERCFKEKCSFETRKGKIPGQHGGGKTKKPTGYAVQLREKQKVKRIYGVLEKQFRLYFERAERSYNELRQKVRQFEDASGLSIQYAMDIPKLGEVARVLMNGAGFWRLRSAMTSAATDAEAVAAVLKRALAQLPSDDVLKREATA